MLLFHTYYLPYLLPSILVAGTASVPSTTVLTQSKYMLNYLVLKHRGLD